MEKNVTVVMSAYNHGEYVRKTIESVLNQTYKGIYFIAVDDASTDDTRDILIEYGDIIDEVHLYDVNSGVSRILPYIMETKTKYIALINSDDYWELDKIEKQVEYLDNHPECVACFTWCNEVNEKGEIRKNIVFDRGNRTREEWMQYFWLNSNCLAHPSILIRTEIYQEQLGKNISRFRQLPDFYMWLNIIQKYEIHIIEEKLCNFRFHAKGENKNVSTPTRTNKIRDFVEQAYIWNEVMKNMDDDFFIKAFQKYMINPNARSHDEIVCEKYFILSMSPILGIQQAASTYFYDNINTLYYKNFIEEHYGFYSRHFHKTQEGIGLNKFLEEI